MNRRQTLETLARAKPVLQERYGVRRLAPVRLHRPGRRPW